MCGNKILKRKLFVSAFASVKADPASRAYYDKESRRKNAITKPSSPWPDTVSIRSTPYCVTARFIKPRNLKKPTTILPKPIDKNDRGSRKFPNRLRKSHSQTHNV